jgi:putative ABC transport system permease protein
VDYDFFKTLNVELADGRTFNRENPADDEAFAINETAAKNLFRGSAIGKEITWERDAQTLTGRVIGVVKDFHYQSLHEPLRPLLFRHLSNYNYVVIKVETQAFGQTMAAIESTWKKFDERFHFEFTFLSDQLNQQYASEQNMATVMVVFAILAAIIASFGLLGMAALSFRQKTKEVSVRKVLGATFANLSVLLLKNFTRTMILAIVLAVPFTVWLMKLWLQNFAFRITVTPLAFFISGGALLVLAWATLAWLTVRMTRVNPAETLKAE